MYLREAEKPSILLSWPLVILMLLALLATGISLDKPTGSLKGSIAIEQSGFKLYTHDIGNRKVYAIAIGPRGVDSIERGVWISSKGDFKIESLPVGEYQIKVRSPGYGVEYFPSVFVDESQTTFLPKTIMLSLVEPGITVSSTVKVFTTKEKPSFIVNGYGISDATVRVYKTDIMKFSDPKSDWTLTPRLGLEQSNNLGEDTHRFDKLTPIATFKRAIAPSFDEASSCDLKLDKPLPPGDFCIVAEATGSTGKKAKLQLSWFSVSDLGLITKKGPDKTLVRAINLLTLKPVPNAVVKMGFDLNYDKTARTDANGFATFTMPSDGSENADLNLNFLATAGPYRAYSDVNYYSTHRDKYLTYFYTDRPVYRLGQTVFFKGLAREKTLTGVKNPGAGLKLTYEVKDPDGNSMTGGYLITNEHGTFNGHVDVGADEKTGAYSVTITYPDQTVSYNNFEIAEYRKPEYKVEVQALTPRIVEGDAGKAKVHATYYFGGPVANARVKYTINSAADSISRYRLNERPAYYDFYDDWNPADDSSYGGEQISEGCVQTDGNGDAVINFSTTRPQVVDDHPYDVSYGDKKYSISVEVTDISRLSVTGDGSVKGTQGDFALFVESPSCIYKVGEPMEVKVKALDYDGHPIANQEIALSVGRYPWDIAKQGYRTKEILANATVRTDSAGFATTKIATNERWPSDNVFISAQANDSHSHKIIDSTSVWISNYMEPYVRSGESAKNEALSVKLNKPVFEPGENARVMITAPAQGNEGLEAIVSVEGPHLFSYKVVKMDATAKLVEIPVVKEDAPNVYVNVTLVDKEHHLYTQDEMLKVTPENNFLALAIKTDKPKYKPGETVHYTVTAKKKDGSPAADTELSLGVVDESIYSIRAETAEDIRKFFYKRRENAVLTACSFPEEFSGGPDKTEPRVRKDFKDTAEWRPAIVTNKEGVATADIKLPDNLTTWRATVRGIDMQTDVGATTQTVIATQDLILRLALPRFFSRGDEGLVTAVVHNYASSKQDVKVTLALSNHFKTDVPLTQVLHIESEGAARFGWHVKIVSSGRGTIQCRAIGQVASDAMEQHLPINPLGIPAFSVKGGLITEASQTVQLPIGLSGDAERSTANFQLNLASSSIGPVLGNFADLIKYPYGCTEQTMSRLMPSIVARTLATKLHQPLLPADAQKFDEVYAMAYDKLSSYHHNDGSWGWWKDDEGNPYLTAYVVEGLHLLNDVGYKAQDKSDETMIKSGLAWMKTNSLQLFKQLCDPKLEKTYNFVESYIDLSRMLYTSSLWKAPIDSQMKASLLKQINTLTPESLAYLAIASHNDSDEATAKLFYDRLIQLGNTSKDLMNWECTPAMGAKLHVSSYYTYRFTYVETTALALRAVLTMEPKNLDRIEAIKRYILLQRGKNGWDNTKTTAEVFRALLQDELQARDLYGDKTVTARVSLNQKTLSDFVSDSSNLYKSQSSIAVPIPTKPGQLTIEKTGEGRLYYSSLVTYLRNLNPGDKVNEKGLPQGLKITRKFFRLAPGPIASDGTIHYKLAEITDGEVKAGETILMKVLVETPVTVPYIMVQAALPSGAEVVEDTDQSREADSNQLESDWGSAWWTHKDVLDDRIVYFGTKLEAGHSEFHSLLRMELPGQINVNPVSLEGMYTNNVRGYSALTSFHVSEQQ